jgi:hypothetical protein
VTPTLTFDAVHAGAIRIDLDRLIESRLLVQANSGGGKSTALRWLLEATFGRVQHLVIDREGEFATLRAEYSYLLVGKEGELAADLRTAKKLARKLLELGASAVVDLSELSLTQQREYVAAFVDALNHLPRELWKDCLVVIDEAHLFAPEKGKGESVARDPIALLQSTGRKRGYCAVLATQRLAKLDKDVAAECLNKLIGRTSSEDMKRAGEELAVDRAGARELRALEPGSFWAYGPAIAVEPVLVRCPAPVTRPPSRGATRTPAPPTPHAIEALAAELRDLPQAAAEEEETVEQLRRQVRELERQVRAKPAPVAATPDVSAIERAVSKGVTEVAHAYRKTLRAIDVQVSKVGNGPLMHAPQALATVSAMLSDALDVSGMAEHYTAVSASATPSVAAAPAHPPRAAADAPRTETPATGDLRLTGTQQRLINAMAFFERLGTQTPTRAAIAGLCAVSHTTGSFSNNLSALRQAGLIEDASSTALRLTRAGKAQVTNVPAIRSVDDVHRLWHERGAVSGTQWRMVEQLIAAYPRPVSRAAIAAALGVQADTGSFSNNLSKLRTLGLMADVSKSDVIATELLFPEGLR